jgi:two-component system sensor histidine kinase DesK
MIGDMSLGDRRMDPPSRTDPAGRTDPASRIDLAEIRASVTSRGARKWYAGSLFGIAWLALIVVGVMQEPVSDAVRWATLALVLVFAAAFVLVPPLAWRLPEGLRLGPALVLLVLSLAFIPALGWDVASMWTFVGIAAGMSAVAPRLLAIFVLVLGGVAIVFELQANPQSGEIWSIPAVIISVSLLMGAFSRQIQLINQLRATQDELAKLAVEEERTRVARDMHDILGHSLTVITVKAELAGRMLDVDPERARSEIADLEELARGALADVRATVGGYRGVNVVSELAGARVALESAGIRADLPATTDVVKAEDRELFGWVVREGVTNVVRHSGAARARVSLGRDFVEVADDGCGPVASVSGVALDRDASSGPVSATGGLGHGLDGLAERAHRAGARLTVGRAPEGGYLVRVAR